MPAADSIFNDTRGRGYPGTDVADATTVPWRVVGDAGQPSFENGWTAVAGPEYIPRFKKLNGVVFMQGSVAGGAASTAAFTLPVGHRPDHTVLCDYDGAFGGLCSVFANGQVVAVAPAYSSMRGTDFPADQ